MDGSGGLGGIKTLSENDGLREAIKTTLNYFYLQLEQGRLIGMEELKEKFGSIWYGKNDIYDIKFIDNVSQRKRELEAINMLHLFHRQQKFSPDTVLATNVKFRLAFPDDVFISGVIPVIRQSNRGLEIVNFKTSNNRVDDFWIRTDMGLTLQALGFQSIFKKEADSICLHYLRHGQMIFTDRKKADTQRLYKSIKMLLATMKNDWYYPRESYHCDKCAVKDICMEWR